jgi:hypothetical protein
MTNLTKLGTLLLSAPHHLLAIPNGSITFTAKTKYTEICLTTVR